MKNSTFSEFKKTTLKEWKERNLISDEIIFTAENSKKSFQTIFCKTPDIVFDDGLEMM